MTPADLSRLLALLHPTYPKEPPPPALGMRVWYTRPLRRDGEFAVDSRDVKFVYPEPCTWADLIGEERVPDIDIITDFRTNEILWRR